MTEEPEQVLEEHRVATACGVEKAGAEMAVEEQHGHPTGQHGHDQDQQEGRDQPRPGEDWHLQQRHARRAAIPDGHDDVDRG
jgi:hypothetical protein